MNNSKKIFRRFLFRGFGVDDLIGLNSIELSKIFNSRCRRKFHRGFHRKSITFLQKLRKNKQHFLLDQKITTVRTHLRNMIIVPEMIGSRIAVYNGKNFSENEIKPDMMAHYTGEFSITYKPVKHGKPGVGATGSSKFVPLK